MLHCVKSIKQLRAEIDSHMHHETRQTAFPWAAIPGAKRAKKVVRDCDLYYYAKLDGVRVFITLHDSPVHSPYIIMSQK